jgi:hypothetical protein
MAADSTTGTADRPSAPANPWQELADALDQAATHRPRRRRLRAPRGATDRGELPARVARAFDNAKGATYKAPPGTVAELLTHYKTRCPSWAHRLYRHAGRKIPGPCRDQECSHCGVESAEDLLRRIYGWVGAEAVHVEITSSEARVEQLRRDHGPVWVLRRRDLGQELLTVLRVGGGGLLNASRDREIYKAVALMPVHRDSPCACPGCAPKEELPSVITQAHGVTNEDVGAAFQAEGVEVKKDRRGWWRWNPADVSDAAWCRIAWVANPDFAQLRGVPYPARDPTPALA